MLVAGIATAVWVRQHNHGNHGHGAHKTPDFDILQAELSKSDGGSTTLAQFESEKILLNFWATWCAPCRHEMPFFDQAAKKLPAVKVVGITVEDREIVNKFLQEIPLNYDIFTSKFDIFYYFQLNGNKTGILPFTVLIDKEGRLLAKKIGEFPDTESIVAFAQKSET
ncbi:MAG: TlpA disulfide reductase family protein [Candidatus Zeuxoniibacter abyssi]|nr:MAG: TlpA disulfide reductase family protein [Candidatus Persebacteraceae bacterium AB1(2)]